MVTIFSNSDSPESTFLYGLMLMILGFYWLMKGDLVTYSRLRWEFVRMKGYDAKIYALITMTIGFILMMLSLVGFAIKIGQSGF